MGEQLQRNPNSESTRENLLHLTGPLPGPPLCEESRIGCGLHSVGRFKPARMNVAHAVTDRGASTTYFCTLMSYPEEVASTILM